jgi:hypothetical protein
MNAATAMAVRLALIHNNPADFGTIRGAIECSPGHGPHEPTPRYFSHRALPAAPHLSTARVTIPFESGRTRMSGGPLAHPHNKGANP